VSLRDLKAPSADGAVLAEPPVSEVADLLRSNRERLAAPAPTVLGRPWDELRRLARHEIVAAAGAYHRQAGEPVPSACPDGRPSHAPRLFLAGHQPELSHPGVWLKNFALCGLARKYGVCPVNLVVDNDTVKSTALRVPTYRGRPSHGHAEDGDVRARTVPFDRWTGEMPYEERVVADEGLFADFPAHVREAIHDWGFVPLLDVFWTEVRRQAARTPLLGERFAAARRALERRWGCHNFEVPVSALCRTESFAWFACHLLADLPRFHVLYNECLIAYRRRYGIRSHNHPVAELTRDGDWLEVPLWAWHAHPGRRGRLLVRRAGNGFELRAGQEVGPTLPFDPGRPEGLVAAWRRLEGQGFKVRSRALTNTIYARLFVADLFIHGLGGAKYDELTDEIVRRFYRLEPPRFLTLTATLRLPLPTFPARPERCRSLHRGLRDVHYNPQRHLPAGAEAAVRRLVAEKQDWIDRQPVDSSGRRERFHVLRALTEQLRLSVADEEQRLRQELERCREEVHANSVLRRRDYAFCLYPEEMLRAFLTRAL
jgi:hypothetical protein